MLPDESYVRELTRDVWTNVLGLEVADGDVGPLAGFADETTACVEITGEWTGAVSLSFPPALSLRVTTLMFQCSDDEATPELVRDALGELANVIGGNVKALLPTPTKLSLPRVGVAAVGEVAQELWFDCEGRPFRVTISTPC